MDPRKYVLDSGPNPPTGRSNFGGHPAHRKTLRVTAAYINAAVYAAKKSITPSAQLLQPTTLRPTGRDHINFYR